MELLDGETLLTRLERIGRMHPAVTLKMLEQVAEALEGAHQAGIVHRDLKPDNIWFWSGNKVFVKVLDFGVAKTGMTTESLQTATGALVGTPQYMSPEQALGNRDIDHRSDLWSLAVIAMECLSGKRPFESAGLGDLLMKIVGGSPPPSRDLAPNLPAGLQEWWSKALARDPRDRFQSATELIDALRPYLAPFEVEGPPGAESARSARVAFLDQAFPERAAAQRLILDSAAASARPSARPLVRASDEPADAIASARAVSVRSAGWKPGASLQPGSLQPGSLQPGRPQPSVAARSVPAAGLDSLAAESAPPRAPGSMGPTSSSRSPQQRRDSRQRTLLVTGGLLVVALLVTCGRMLLTSVPEDAGATASRGPAPSGENGPVPSAADPAKPALPSVEAARTPPPSATEGERSPPLGQPSPWEPALRGNKAGEPSTTAQSLQPGAGNPAEPGVKPSVAGTPVRPGGGPVSSAAGANPGPSSAAPASSAAAASAKPAAGSAKAPPQALEAAVKHPTEATRPPPRVVAGQSVAGQSVAGQSPAGQSPAGQTVAGQGSAGDSAAGESEAARKERLRKATGL